MIPFHSTDQLKVGQYLKIIPKNGSEKYTYQKVSVKKIVDNGIGVEILIDLDRNYYFNADLVLRGESNWVKEIQLHNEPLDQEAILMLKKRGRLFRSMTSFLNNSVMCERFDPEGFVTCNEDNLKYGCEYCETIKKIDSIKPITNYKKLNLALDTGHDYISDLDWRCDFDCGCELCTILSDLNNKRG